MPITAHRPLKSGSVILLCAVLPLSAAFAAPSGESAPPSDMEYQQLLDLLEEQTTIATKTRLNADYVPGIVTVLHGHDMESNGSRTVWEALAKAPGVELSIEETGRKQVVVRGIGRTYASGTVKLMLNGIAMNSAQLAFATPVLNIPIEQVERIEIIRGPGASIHGEFAYTGVVNVITYNDENRVYARAGEGQHRGGGGLYSYHSPEQDFKLGLNLGHWQEDGVEVIAGQDALYGEGKASSSNAPGPTNEKQEDTTAILDLDYRDYTLNLQWLEDGSGDFFGINDYLPPDEKKIVTRYRYRSAELGRAFDRGRDFHARLYLSWLRNEEEKDGLFTSNASSGAPYVVDTDYAEERLGAGLELQWRGWKDHQLLLAYDFSKTETQKNEKSYGQEGGSMTAFSAFIKAGTTRRINSLTLQDEYHPNPMLTVTTGVRHDRYSDVGSSTTPRLAAVYRLSRKHILKAQYAQAFRPPTFYELGGKVDEIDPSTIETYEAGYIFKGRSHDMRLTLFRSELEKPIIFVDTSSTRGYINSDGSSLYGVEAEWDYRYSHRLKLKSNLSYLQTRDDANAEPIAGSSDWLANIGLDYSPAAHSVINLQYRYVGDVHRATTDSRDKLSAYTTLDATYSLSNPGAEGYSLRLGVKNLLDNDVVYPAPADTYPDDRPRPGRYWWASLGYRF